MKHILVSLAALTLLTAAALPASAGVLYSQRTDPALSGSWQSQTANGTNGFDQKFDDFSLSTTGTINNVSWTGFLSPSSTAINGFTIGFYQDNFDNVDFPGAVGTLLASTVIAGDAGQAANSIPDAHGFGVFNFSTAIDPFVATGGTTYWISIVADPFVNSGNVRWAVSDHGDGTFNSFDGNAVTSIGQDLAFTLSNSAVPEPSGLVLDGSGLIVLAGFGRRLLARSART
ncbi:MAG TPA: hypothetical protein VIJ79_12850 [Acidobacteriaceae bacterium]